MIPDVTNDVLPPIFRVFVFRRIASIIIYDFNDENVQPEQKTSHKTWRTVKLKMDESKKHGSCVRTTQSAVKIKR